MSAVIVSKELFDINRKLRAYAAKHHASATELLIGCAAAKQELNNHRSAEFAVAQGERAMGCLNRSIAPQARLA